MTNPLPESAVELAARLEALATDMDNFAVDLYQGSASVSDFADRARAIAAALPAIREAVVGELAETIVTLATIVRLHEGNRDPEINALLAKAAALTEQENRNDQERSHDER